MSRGLLARMSLLVMSFVAVSGAAPLTFGLLTLNDVRLDQPDPLDNTLEFRLTNLNGLGFTNFLNSVTFSNVRLDLTWVGGNAPPGIIGPLDWYLDGDDMHQNRINPANLAPSLLSYESTRITRRYGIEKGVLTMDLTPPTGWTQTGGTPFTPLNPTYELVFWMPAPGLAQRDSNSSLPSWDLLLEPSQQPSDVPEPASWLMGGIGALGMLIGRRVKRQS